MASPSPPHVRHGQGAAARVLTSFSSWSAWVSWGAYEWLASAALRLSSWGGGASASTAAKAPDEEKFKKASGGKKGSKKPRRTNRGNGDFPVDLRPPRRDGNDDDDVVRSHLFRRSSSANGKSPLVDPSEDRDKVMHLSFKEENEKCKNNHTLCLECFMRSFGSRSQYSQNDGIPNDRMRSHYDQFHGRGSLMCTAKGCHVRAKYTGDIGRHTLHCHPRKQ